MSGIVAANTATPPTDRLHVSADVRLFDAGGIVASPFDDGKGTVAVAGRYSYTGLSFRHFPAPIRSTTGTTKFVSSTRWGLAP